jgi:chromate transporter
MAPIVIGLLVSAGWILSVAQNDYAKNWKLWLVTVVATVVVTRTSIHLLWLIAAGGLVGATGIL